MNKSIKLMGLGIAAAMTMSLAVTASAADADTFTYAIAGDPGANVNPINSQDRWGLMTSNMVYSPLFKLNGTDIDWYLATGYELSNDDHTYTFTLRDDVKWTDGEAFTADDVIFTIEEIMDPANASEMYENFVTEEGAVEIEKIDDYTVSFTFAEASPAHLEAFAYQIYIVPEHVFADVADYDTYEVATPTVTTGAYVLTEYSAGSYLKFEKNADYFLGEPNIGTIVYRIITSDDTASLAIQSGEIDAWATSPTYVSQIDLEANNLTVQAFNQGRVGYMAMNAKTMTDKNLRKAILFALDKEQLNLGVYLSKDYYDEIYTFLPPNNAYYNDTDVEKYAQDLDKAKEYLAEAGGSADLTLAYSATDKTMEVWALLIQNQLMNVGINVTLSPIEQTAYYNELREEEKSFDLYFGGCIMGADPQTYATLYTTGSSSNYAFMSIPEVDSLFAKGVATFDTEERAAIYKELQEVMQEEAYFYPITSNSYLLLMNNRVGGIEECGLTPIYNLRDPANLTLN